MRVRGPTFPHPVPISASLCYRNAGAISAVFAPCRPPRKRADLATGRQIILPFSCRSRSARSTNWQSGESHEVRTYTISTPFRLCAVCDAVKTADNRQKNPPVSGGRQSQFPDDSCFEVLLYPLNLPQEHSKNNSDDGTGCVIV